MAVTIRLSRHGRKKLPFYRIVAADEDKKRDGRYLELLGTFDPIAEPPILTLKEERVKYWIGVGAKTSDTFSQLMEKQHPGYLSSIVSARRKKLQAARKKRKTTAKKSATGTKKVSPRKAAKKAAKKSKATAKNTAKSAAKA